MLLASLSKEHGLTAPLMAALYQHYFPPCAATALPAADATADAPQTAPRRGGDKRGARPVALINLHFVALCCAAGVLLCGRLAVQGFTALQFSKEDNASTGWCLVSVILVHIFFCESVAMAVVNAVPC